MSHPIENYRRWWVGKYCRLVRSRGEFKRVVDVEFYGPPSGFYGTAFLVFEDGSQIMIPHGDAFKPRKKDVEVWPHDDPPPPMEDV